MQTKVSLNEDEMPRQWYNLAADLPSPLQPPLGPGGLPITPDMLAPVFPMNIIEQEVSAQRWIDIPEGILELLRLWRPSPLHRAFRPEAALGTPAKIFSQERERFSGRQPQTEHGGGTSMVQQGVRHQEDHHRDRRRPMGERARILVCASGVGM